MEMYSKCTVWQTQDCLSNNYAYANSDEINIHCEKLVDIRSDCHATVTNSSLKDLVTQYLSN